MGGSTKNMQISISDQISISEGSLTLETNDAENVAFPSQE